MKLSNLVRGCRAWSYISAHFQWRRLGIAFAVLSPEAVHTYDGASVMANDVRLPNLPQWLASLLCIAASGFGAPLLAALVFLWSNDWFGSGDLSAFNYWNAIFTVLLSAAGLVLMKYLCLLPPLVRSVVAVLTGSALGFLWTVVVYVMLGQWFGAFSFPVLYCWVIGGATALLLTQAVYAKLGRALR
jgi:hypothetical protein